MLGPCSSTIYPRKMKSYVKEDIHRDVHNFITDGHTLETTQVPVCRERVSELLCLYKACFSTIEGKGSVCLPILKTTA